MSGNRRRPSRADYRIVVICAMQKEWDVVEALFDVDWEETEKYPKPENDPNAYSMGRIGHHNIVLAYMPGIGKKNSTSVATHFTYSFPNIKLGLVVGVCGGVPSALDFRSQIFLGDVVVSTEVVQCDLGWQQPDKFVTKDTLQDRLSRPSQEIRSFLAKMQSRKSYKRFKESTFAHLTKLLENEDFRSWKYPGLDLDILWESTYRHKHQKAADCTLCADCKGMNDRVCDLSPVESCVKLGCNTATQVARARASTIEPGVVTPQPVIHFGRVASSDSVMKSSVHRDRIVNREGVIGFEMEGAGAWDSFPTVVIKGVSDYSDSHKDFRWQWYAAISAAACMKAFLEQWRVPDGIWEPEAQSSSVALSETRSGEVIVSTQDRLKARRGADFRSNNDIIEEVETACIRIHQQDENMTKEGLEAAQRVFKRALKSPGPQESSFLQRIYWGLMIVEKRFGCYGTFDAAQKMEHIEMAEQYSHRIMETLPKPVNPSLLLQVNIEREIIKGQKAKLQLTKSGNIADIDGDFSLPNFRQAELRDRR